MGKFGEQLLNSLADGATGGISGLISGAISGIGGLLGIGEKRQMRNQKELQSHAAQLNYQYGEKAADNAFNRQMVAYEQSRSDNSFEAKRNQMEDAGLSVGLMYGSGAQGGGR